MFNQYLNQVEEESKKDQNFNELDFLNQKIKALRERIKEVETELLTGNEKGLTREEIQEKTNYQRFITLHLLPRQFELKYGVPPRNKLTDYNFTDLMNLVQRIPTTPGKIERLNRELEEVEIGGHGIAGLRSYESQILLKIRNLEEYHKIEKMREQIEIDESEIFDINGFVEKLNRHIGDPDFNRYQECQKAYNQICSFQRRFNDQEWEHLLAEYPQLNSVGEFAETVLRHEMQKGKFGLVSNFNAVNIKSSNELHTQKSVKLNWTHKLNVLATLFFELSHEPYNGQVPIEASAEDIIRVIVGNFTHNGKEIKPGTLKTYLNSSKPEKRAKSNKKIPIEGYFKDES